MGFNASGARSSDGPSWSDPARFLRRELAAGSRRLAPIVALLVLTHGSGAAQNLTVFFWDVTEQAGIAVVHGYEAKELDQLRLVAGGAAGGDVDGDGWPDLYVVGGDVGRQYMFRNRGDGTFEDIALTVGVAATGELICGPALADIDGDGDLDLFVGMIPGDVFVPDPSTPGPALYRNDGTDGFVEVARSANMFPFAPYTSASFGDFDGDGDLDLFTTHWAMPWPFMEADHLWRNDGTGRFAPATFEAELGIAREEVDATWALSWSFTANFADIDSDGNPDILLVSDFGLTQVFRNLGDGRFQDVSTDVLSDENGMGVAVGDFDNDGHLDWFVTSIFAGEPIPAGRFGISGNRLYRNRGDGTFADVTDAAGVRDGAWGWGACAADFDNDGWLDIFHVNGWDMSFIPGFRGRPAVLFMNNGDGTFRERAVEAGIDDRGEGRGVVCFDYDRDGDIDVFVGNITGPVRLYRNELDGRANFLQVKLVGRPPNTEGIGARVLVRHTGKQQMRELRAGSNYVSQDPAVAHFGLGADVEAEEVEIVWPGGERSLLRRVAANQHLVVYQQVGDANCDGVSSAADLIAGVTGIAATPSAAPCPGADLDYDGTRDLEDLRLVVSSVFSSSRDGSLE